MPCGNPARYEKLEKRALLSVSLSVSTGLLSISGSKIGDQIVLLKSGSSVKVEEAGTNYSFTASQVKSVKVTLGSGADLVSIASSITAATSLTAGAGDDTLVAGGGPTTFVFGTAASGNAPVQYVLSPGSGGAALDFSGVPAVDEVTVDLTSDSDLANFASATVTTMTAGQAALFTTVTGGAADDYFTANSAADSLVGGSGSSTLVAGSGNDTLVGTGSETDYMFSDEPAPVTYTLSQAKPGQNALDFSALSADDPVTVNLNFDLLASYTNVRVVDAKAGEFNNFNEVYGGQGEDILTANNKGDTILGGNGDQVMIYGGSGADLLVAGGGFNIISGEGGADTILGGDGFDIVYATDYTSDPLWYTPPSRSSNAAGLQVYAGAGDASIVGGPGNDTLVGGEGNCTIHGMGGDDVITGGQGNSVLFGDAGNDTIAAGQGDNTICGGAGANVIYGGTVGGTNTFIDKNLPDNRTTTGQDMVLDTDALTAAAIAADQGLSAPTYPLVGAAGSGDTVFGGSANTTIIGGGGDETISGGDGPSELIAGSGDDLVAAGNGAATLQGGAGEDTLAAGGSPDLMVGGTGNTTFLNNNGYADTVIGGSGFNEAQDDPTGLSTITGIQVTYVPNYTSDIATDVATTAVPSPHQGMHELVPGPPPPPATISGGILTVGSKTYAGDQTIGISEDANGVLTVSESLVGTTTFSSAGLKQIDVFGGPGDDNINLFNTLVPANINTGNGNNYVVGGPGNEIITGGSGNDTLIGAGGRNVISGGAGNNVLYGGTGNDSITGGPGSDWIVPGGYNVSVSNDAESDTIVGGSGTEKLDFAGDADNMVIRLDKGTATDTVTGAVTKITRVRNLWAGAGNDLIVGATAGGVLLNAGSGNDTLFGISASDIIYGGVGNDLAFLDGNQGFMDLYGNHATTPGNTDNYNPGTTILPPSVDATDIKVALQHFPP